MRRGWQTKTLGDLFDITSSKRVFEADWKSEGVPFYRAREIVKLAKYGFVENELFISEEMFEKYSKKYGIPGEGDIMVTGVGTLGICYVVKAGDRFYFKDGNIIWLKRKSQENSRFVEYAFKSNYMRSQIDDAVGATVGTFTIIKAKNTRVSVPPLEEQKRIVAILDEAFEGIDAAIANTKKNLVNARELFDSYLNSVVDEAWESCDRVSLSELATDITDGDHLPPPKAETGIPFITIRNINKETRTVDFTDTFMVGQQYFDALKANRKPKKGDVLYTVTGSFGIPVIINDDFQFCFQRHIGLIRPKAETESAWLYYLLLSPQIFAQAREGATGTAQKTVSLKVLRGFQVPRVPLPRQRTAVAQLDAMATNAARLENINRQKLTRLGELKQTLLHKAFTGELTAQLEKVLEEVVA